MHGRELILVLFLCAGCGRHKAAATWNQLRGEPYVLDGISRELKGGKRAVCPEQIEYRNYGGQLVRLKKPVLVARPFIPKLQAFERVLQTVAKQHYGRPPDRILHFGSRACRTVRGNKKRLSEHALGNAIDISGFEWTRVKKDRALRDGAERAFTISVKQHWPESDDAFAERHSRFLHALVERTVDEEIFRGVIGPGREGHADHLHFDVAPWDYKLF